MLSKAAIKKLIPVNCKRTGFIRTDTGSEWQAVGVLARYLIYLNPAGFEGPEIWEPGVRG